jgi:hypothetical protein
MMKSLLITAALSLSATSALASGYRCDFGPAKSDNPIALRSTKVSFTFDPVTQDKASADAGDGIEVGCLAFRSRPELLGCWIGTASDIAVATTDAGVRVLGTATKIDGNLFSLNCNRF